MGKILIVDDEKNQRLLLRKLLEREGYSVIEAENGEEAIRKTREEEPEIILLDQKLPDIQGIEILTNIKEINPLIPVIIITAYGEIKDAVEAMRKGAFYYLTKPVNPDELILLIKKAFENLGIQREVEGLKRIIEEKYSFNKLIYVSDKMKEIMDIVIKASKSDANVLITGESGTGKELIAGAIHYFSKRKNEKFVPVDISAIPETLVEAELFGYEKGAFTGAERRRIGKFEFASKGTIFLDEIGNLPLSLQAKLLRVIEEKKITRIGSNEEIPVDVRIISATNKNIEEEVKKGNFREDLYYRLNVIRIHLPPLRERKEDIPVLTQHFLKIYSKRENKRIKGITDEALKILMEYNFPGNVRELENIIERGVVLCDDEYIKKEHLSLIINKEIDYKKTGKLLETIEKIEREMIIEALRKNNWVQVKAAEELGISERVLRYKMKKYKIEKERT
ncbi:MAG: sigma-54 dependent transcriptional regulator [candidate division WOR-3 bacterium]